MKNLLIYLDGKKAIILTIAGLILNYLIVVETLDAKLGALILGVLNLLAGGTVIATNKVLGKRDNLGQRSKK